MMSSGTYDEPGFRYGVWPAGPEEKGSEEISGNKSFSGLSPSLRFRLLDPDCPNLRIGYVLPGGEAHIPNVRLCVARRKPSAVIQVARRLRWVLC